MRRLEIHRNTRKVKCTHLADIAATPYANHTPLDTISLPENAIQRPYPEKRSHRGPPNLKLKVFLKYRARTELTHLTYIYA